MMLSTWYKVYNHQDQGLNFIKHTNITPESFYVGKTWEEHASTQLNFTVCILLPCQTAA